MSIGRVLSDIPLTENERRTELEKMGKSISGVLNIFRGAPPDEVFINPEKLRRATPTGSPGTVATRFQSMSKFKKDCEKTSGFHLTTSEDGLAPVGRCLIPNVTRITTERHKDEDAGGIIDSFGIVHIAAKGMSLKGLNIVGFPGYLWGNLEQSGIHLTPKAYRDEIIEKESWGKIAVDHQLAALIGRRWDRALIPKNHSKYRPSFSHAMMNFATPRECIVSAYGLAPSDNDSHRLIFHGKRAQKFNPEMATIRTVRIDCDAPADIKL